MSESETSRKMGGVVLEGELVRLEPLAEHHTVGLCEGCLDPGIWTFMSRSIVTAEAMEQHVARLLEGNKAGQMATFATIDRASNRVAGSTSFGAIELSHLRAEIGWTFVAPSFQRTGINREAKYLMFRHAFEDVGLRRVELKTDSRNERSRTAILALGATEEGLLRKHMVTQGGVARDSVYFSVTDDEWPQIRQRFEDRLYGPPGEV